MRGRPLRRQNIFARKSFLRFSSARISRRCPYRENEGNFQRCRPFPERCPVVPKEEERNTTLYSLFGRARRKSRGRPVKTDPFLRSSRICFKASDTSGRDVFFSPVQRSPRFKSTVSCCTAPSTLMPVRPLPATNPSRHKFLCHCAG